MNTRFLLGAASGILAMTCTTVCAAQTATPSKSADLTITIGGSTLTLAPGSTAAITMTDKGYSISITTAPATGTGAATGAAASPASATTTPPPATPTPIVAGAQTDTSRTVQTNTSAPVAAPPGGGGVQPASTPPPVPAIAPIIEVVAPAPATPPASGANSSSTSKTNTNTFCTLLGFDCGLGLTYAHTFGSERIDSLTPLQRPGGAVYLQAKTIQNDNIAVLVELHHFFKKGSSPPDPKGVVTKFDPAFQPIKGSATAGHDLGAAALCGPFIFTTEIFTDGCGPLAVASVGTDGKSATQFGIGWAAGVPNVGGADGTGFNIGIGVMFDPSEQVLDGRVVNQNTQVVLPAYQAAVMANPNLAIVHRPTHSLFLMISKTLGQ